MRVCGIGEISTPPAHRTGGVARELVDRAYPFRFHLDRDVDFVQYAITKMRLLAGLGRPGARQPHFFIADEGITAAAYVVVSVVGGAAAAVWRRCAVLA